MDQSGSDIPSMVQHRRRQFTKAIPAQRRYWGLALSGGGIRSATFCLGLIKALAKKGQLRQFDLMSTVSGGGYAGSSLGKLMQEAGSAQKLEAELARMDVTWWLSWLRANGRYLTPNGAKDTLFAFANFGRNLLGVHLELGLMGLLVGCALAAIDLGIWAFASEHAGRVPTAGNTPLWWSFLPTAATFPTLFLLLPILAMFGAILCGAYWLLPGRLRGPSNTRLAITATLALIGLAWLGYVVIKRVAADGENIDFWFPVTNGWLVLGVFYLGGWFGGACLAGFMRSQHKSPDVARNRLTRYLGVVLTATLCTLLLGWADQLAWYLATNDGTGNLGPLLVTVGVALRVALPMMANVPKGLAPLGRSTLLRLFSLLGLALLAALLVFWISIVHGLVSAAVFPDNAQEAVYLRGWLALGSLALPALLLMAASWSNLEFLNRSSLQPFYRARLVRAYLGATNQKRIANGQGPMHHRPASPADLAVATPVAEDDISLSDYAPHRTGGPVQLLNVCINQTQDPRSGIFNSDRKGESMTVAPGGLMRVGSDAWQQMDRRQAMSLGDWMAISGAAFAPGLGASTRSGLAALLTLAGIRLGYWWDSAQQEAGQRLGKYALVLAELCGRFPGRARRHWFLTDGGHFDNTGGYALLREECELIVLADCGADPAYSFEDVENLVRKARIDLDVEIVFQRPDTANRAGAYGALADLACDEVDACLALAKVHYRTSDLHGYLILVKPNLCSGLSVDLQNFKANNPLFPQEPTTDQFFNEAQWESYFQLGCRLGNGIILPPEAPENHFEDFVPDDGTVMVTGANGRKQLRYNGGRRVSRLVSVGTVGATISFGAVASAGLAAWQVFEKQTEQTAAAKELSEPAFQRLRERYFAATSAKAPASIEWNTVADELLGVEHQYCKGQIFTELREKPLLKTILETTYTSCQGNSQMACSMLLNSGAKSCLTPIRQSCAPRYWVREYDEATGARSNCMPADTDQTVAATLAPQYVEPTSTACEGYTVYIQIYGPDLRDAARGYRSAWQALGASVAPIEDVLDTARRERRKTPAGYAQPTAIQYTQAGAGCASELIRNAGANREPGLPDNWKNPSTWQQRTLVGAPDKRIIEIWLPGPPAQDAPQQAVPAP
jgi:hypothetical protein